MPIEFHCVSCQQFLRVPDDAAGKQAKCPKCQQVLAVPDSSPPPKPSLGTPELNPYASPQTTQMQDPAALRPVKLGALDAGFTITTGWEFYKRRFGFLLGVTLLLGAVSLVLNLPFIFAQMSVEAHFRRSFGGLWAIRTLFYLVELPLGAFLAGGFVNYFLKLTRGQRVELGELFSGLPHMGAMLLASLLMNGPFNVLMFAITSAADAFGRLEIMGLMFLLFVPMIYVSLVFGEFPFLIVDRNLSAWEALQTSAQLTTGNRGALFVIFLALTLFLIAGAMACIVGMFFVLPLFMVVPTLAYRQMIGEEIRAE